MHQYSQQPNNQVLLGLVAFIVFLLLLFGGLFIILQFLGGS